jgi:V8-like Glu-specific endopeptidase
MAHIDRSSESRRQFLRGAVAAGFSVGAASLARGAVPVCTSANSNSVVGTKGLANPSDERKVVHATLQPPNLAIAHLQITLANRQEHIVGTGFFINPTTLLTAAHLLFPKEPKYGDSVNKPVHSVAVYPARNGASRPIPSVKAASFTHEPRWETPPANTPNLYFDYGVIKLPKAVPQVSTQFVPTLFDPNVHTSGTLCGYPDGLSAPVPEDYVLFSQYTETGNILCYFPDPPSAPGLVNFKIDTSEGQSGSPVYVMNGNQPAAFAIYINTGIGTVMGSNFNVGVRVTQDTLNFIG